MLDFTYLYKQLMFFQTKVRFVKISSIFREIYVAVQVTDQLLKDTVSLLKMVANVVARKKMEVAV